MENPFEIINQRLNRIETLLNTINTKINNGKNIYPELMDLTQVSEYLNLSKSKLYKMTSSNLIPHSKKGKKLYFNKEKVTNWVLENKVLTQEEMQDKANEYSIKRRARNKQTF